MEKRWRERERDRSGESAATVGRADTSSFSLAATHMGGQNWFMINCYLREILNKVLQSILLLHQERKYGAYKTAILAEVPILRLIRVLFTI